MKAEEPVMGWVCVVFFGMGVPIALLMFLPGLMSLRLNSEGVEMKSLRPKHMVLWKDVESFEIGSIGGAKMIIIRYRPHYQKQPFARAAARAVSGVESAIPNSYNISLINLEKILNDWLVRFGQQAQSS
jgi:hypothetical protein